MWKRMHRRYQYLMECWEHSTQHWLVGLVTGLVALYGMGGAIEPFLDVPPLLSSLTAKWPKLPLSWALVICLLAILFITAEGGYRRLWKESHEQEGHSASK